MKNIADKSIDCVICDLPYAITSNKWGVERIEKRKKELEFNNLNPTLFD